MKSKFLILGALAFVFTNLMFGQPGDPDEPVFSTVLSPAIHWQSEFFPDIDLFGNPQEKEDSGEEWYYEMIETKANGVATGYAVAGFVGDRAFESYTVRNNEYEIVECLSFNNNGLEACEFFWTNGNRTGIKRQIVVWYDLNGNIIQYKRYNVGEAWAITQDDDGNIYIAGIASNSGPVGESDELIFLPSEAQITSIPMYYNPSTVYPYRTFDPQNQLTADCDNGPWSPKLNVVKLSPAGDVIWNNTYGLENNMATAFSQGGVGKAIAVDGNQLLVGGSINGTPQGTRKYLVSIDKNTGFYAWNRDFHPDSDGEIRQIIREDNNFLISGTEITNQQGFVALCDDQNDLLMSTGFTTIFYEQAEDIPSSISNNLFDPLAPSNSTSAIFADGNIYWFLIAENQAWGGASGLAQGVVLEMNYTGNYTGVDHFGEIRAYDLFLSGTPIEGGGFALVTSRHTTQFFNTGLLPTINDPLDLNNPSGPTLGDCFNEITEDYCFAFDEPNSSFYNWMSTCTYVRKYGPGFEFQWDKIWDSESLAPRECFPHNLKQQECMYRIIQSSDDGGLLVCGNTSDNYDDGYLVKLYNDCNLEPFFGNPPTGTDLIVDYNVFGSDASDGLYEIDGAVTWSSPKMVLGKVVITPGSTLTIENTEVQFASATNIESVIDVQQNGTLIVNHSTLTSLDGCGTMWGGINVWGDTDEHQYAFGGGQYHVGRAIFNNAVIKHANTAIRNWEPNNWDSRGGIIQATNTNFVNNRRSAEFYKYQNTSPSNPLINRADRSFFKLCNFIVDDDMPVSLDDHPLIAGITFWDVDRIQIQGCDFINSSTVQNSESRKSAIYTHEASYIISEHCNVPNLPYGTPCPVETENNFTGWHIGIDPLETASGRSVRVRNSVFDQNMIGIALEGGLDGTEIYWNDFFLGNHPYEYDGDIQTPELAHLGIHTTETHLFNIEDNRFERATDATNDAHGVLIHNTKGHDNKIYRNTFENLKVAANGWQVNRNANSIKIIPAGAIGLQFLCNENSGNEKDFVISRLLTNSSAEYANSGMRNNQGNYEPPRGANNTFSAPNGIQNNYTHWTADVNPNILQRYNHNSNPPDPNEVSPLMDVNLVSVDNQCITNYPTNSGIVEVGIFKDLVNAVNEFGAIQYTYMSVIDNGNTQAMLNDIALTWPNDAWQLRDELMARSPYNSVEVLVSAAQKEIMPHAMLLEVLVANPDALQSGQVIYVVEHELNNPMPQYMIDMLHLAQNETTLRTAMESAMSYWHAEASGFQKKALASKQFSLEDIDEPDSTLIILSKVKTPGSDLTRAAVLMRNGNYGAAINLVDSINVHYKLLNSEHQDMANLKNFYSFMAQLNSQGKEIPQMNESEIAVMQEFAENPIGGITAQKAQNALCFHHNICYTSEGSPKNNAPKAPKPYPTEKEVLSHFNKSSAYPNPAVDNTTIQYELFKAKNDTRLHIYDALGRRVESISIGEVYEGQTLIDTRRQANGVYIYEIVQDGKQVLNGKFIVNR